jgi:glucose-1-phosphate adenylyltransferase
MAKILCIILGGGKGTRLFPLTKERAKPAVPFGGRYRLVDIPISNCINSDFKNIYVLTQFNSTSLHLHIGRTYNFDSFTHGFVEILAAEQTFDSSDWYMGTADAVRKNFSHFRTQSPTHYIILSGDQLYKMDLEQFFSDHLESRAEITVAATPVTRSDADQLGILSIDKKGMISAFLEKPGPEKNIDEYKLPADLARNDGKDYLASMGIYIFNADVMEKCLASDATDFGKEIIPQSINKLKVRAHFYDGYWEDIGTIKNFYEANLDLASTCPKFNLYDSANPIYTHRRDLPPSKVNSCTFKNSLAAEGSIITDAFINNSLVGIRTIIESGATLDRVYCMGADYYETDEEKLHNQESQIPNLGIGSGSIIKGAIIDKNARIGHGCRIGIDRKDRPDADFDNYQIRDGIIVIPKNAILADGTCI